MTTYLNTFCLIMSVLFGRIRIVPSRADDTRIQGMYSAFAFDKTVEIFGSVAETVMCLSFT